MDWFPKYNYILASKSPRRQELLKLLGISFQVKIMETNEIYPNNLKCVEIPVYLSELKAKPFLAELGEDDLLITADTIVCKNEIVLGKPKDKKEAFLMLSQLSGSVHQVITGVCLSSKKKKRSFYSVSNVEFKALLEKEIEHYIEICKPFDKAGSYGIQEWIGIIGITHIEGSFYNVMGLPIQKLYEEIQKFDLA